MRISACAQKPRRRCSDASTGVCSGVNACDSSPCQNGGTCISTGDATSSTFFCSCVAGYSGDTCGTEETQKSYSTFNMTTTQPCAVLTATEAISYEFREGVKADIISSLSSLAGGAPVAKQVVIQALRCDEAGVNTIVDYEIRQENYVVSGNLRTSHRRSVSRARCCTANTRYCSRPCSPFPTSSQCSSTAWVHG